MSTPIHSSAPTLTPSSPTIPQYESAASGRTPGEDGLVKTAPYPFDNAFSDADVVLRAVDGTRFYLHKAVLRVASMFFADMFSLPQPPSPGSETGPDAIPTIPVTEDSEPLERLLRMCYPVDRPEVSDSVQTVAPILGAALKYQMPVVTKLMTKSLSSHCSMSPLAVFAVAYQLDLEEIGAKAIHEFTDWYNLPIPVRKSGTKVPNIISHLCRAHSLDDYSSDMDAIPAAVYYRLLDHYTTTTTETLPWDAEAAVQDIFSRGPRHLEIRVQEAETPMGRLAHPFHNTARANTIIRSSDNAVFHVDRYLLSFASPILAKLFSVPSTTAASDSKSLQVSSATRMTHHLPENGRTLSKLFQLSYPMPDPEPIGSDSSDVRLKDALALLVAAQKYEVARAIAFAKRACVEAATTSPVRLYLLATQYNWDDVAEDAAMRAVYETADAYCPEMKSASAAAYRRLLVYCRSCRDVILSGGATEQEPRPAASTRSAYWSKSSWLKRPEELKFWLAFHERVNRCVDYKNGEPVLLMDVDALLPSSVIVAKHRRSAARAISNPAQTDIDDFESRSLGPEGYSRQLELRRIANGLVKITL